MNKIKALLIITVGLLTLACSQQEPEPMQAIAVEKFSNEDEVLFQQEAALRHTLESLKQQEKEEQALLQDNQQQ